MPEQDYVHPKMTNITCYKCGSKNTVEANLLKYRPDMTPFVCEMCEKGIEFGSLEKLEKFIINKFEINNTTVVDFIIDSLSKEL